MANQPVYFTASEVAERFRVDSSTVRRWVKRGQLAASITTPGGHFRFTESDLSALSAPAGRS